MMFQYLFEVCLGSCQNIIKSARFIFKIIELTYEIKSLDVQYSKVSHDCSCSLGAPKVLVSCSGHIVDLEMICKVKRICFVDKNDKKWRGNGRLLYLYRTAIHYSKYTYRRIEDHTCLSQTFSTSWIMGCEIGRILVNFSWSPLCKADQARRPIRTHKGTSRKALLKKLSGKQANETSTRVLHPQGSIRK